MSQNIHFVHDHSILMPYGRSSSCHDVHLLCGIASVLGIQIVEISAKRYEKEKQQWDEVGNESKAPSSLLFHLFLLIFSQFKEDRWQIVVARNI